MNQKGFAGIIFIGAFASLVIGGAITVVASDNSKPGDSLYSLDRNIEDFQGFFAVSDASQIKFNLKQAEERLSEIKALKASDAKKTNVDDKIKDYKKASEDYSKSISGASDRLFTISVTSKKIDQKLADTVTKSYTKQLDDLVNVRTKLPIQVEEIVAKAMSSSEVNLEKSLAILNDKVDQEKRDKIAVKIEKSKELRATADEKIQKALEKVMTEKQNAISQGDKISQQVLQNVQTIIVEEPGKSVSSPGQPGSTSPGRVTSTPGSTIITKPDGSVITFPGTGSGSGDPVADRQAKIDKINKAIELVRAYKEKYKDNPSVVASLQKAEDALRDTLAKLQ